MERLGIRLIDCGEDLEQLRVLDLTGFLVAREGNLLGLDRMLSLALKQHMPKLNKTNSNA
jgi:hypothetical protein